MLESGAGGIALSRKTFARKRRQRIGFDEFTAPSDCLFTHVSPFLECSVIADRASVYFSALFCFVFFFSAYSLAQSRCLVTFCLKRKLEVSTIVQVVCGGMSSVLLQT